MTNPKPYNPLAKKNLGASAAEALLESKVHPLAALAPFFGVGIYAIYYVGDFSPYTAISACNMDGRFKWPIYVGKAVPSGARKGMDIAGKPSKALSNRLNEHAETICSTDNLDINDFHCRYLTVDDIWIPLGESLMIARFFPLWNNFVDGFGNHDPGSKRYDGMRPRWDVIHPGRAWAAKCAPRPEKAADIIAEIETYLRTHPSPERPKLLTE